MTADQLAALLDELQKRLEGPAKYVFELAVRQVFIEGAMGLVLGVALLLLLGVGWRFGVRRVRALEQSYDREFAGLMGGLIGGLVSLLVAGFAVYSITDGLPKLLNPEYAALRSILAMLIPGTGK